MKILRANSSDGPILTQITLRSKDYWGYGAEQIKKWEAELTINADYINQKEVYKLVGHGKTIGYYSFFAIDKGTIQLDNLFVLPEYIGQGLGKLLLDDFFEIVRKRNIEKVVLYSDPNAENFYLKYGFKVVEKIATSIPGRFLPKMIKDFY